MSDYEGMTDEEYEAHFDKLQDLVDRGIARDLDEAEELLGMSDAELGLKSEKEKETVVEGPTDKIEEPEERFKSEGDDYGYPTMDNAGQVKKMSHEEENTLGNEHEAKREAIIQKRIADLRTDARSYDFESWEVNLMAKALEKELKGAQLSELIQYNRRVQTDYDRLKAKVNRRLGRDTKSRFTDDTEEAQLNREYPSMSKNPSKEFRRALDLPEK